MLRDAPTSVNTRDSSLHEERKREREPETRGMMALSGWIIKGKRFTPLVRDSYTLSHLSYCLRGGIKEYAVPLFSSSYIPSSPELNLCFSPFRARKVPREPLMARTRDVPAFHRNRTSLPASASKIEDEGEY